MHLPDTEIEVTILMGECVLAEKPDDDDPQYSCFVVSKEKELFSIRVAVAETEPDAIRVCVSIDDQPIGRNYSCYRMWKQDLKSATHLLVEPHKSPVNCMHSTSSRFCLTFEMTAGQTIEIDGFLLLDGVTKCAFMFASPATESSDSQSSSASSSLSESAKPATAADSIGHICVEIFSATSRRVLKVPGSRPRAGVGMHHYRKPLLGGAA